MEITLVDTGDYTMTGGRIKRIKDYIEDGEDFCLTYGDGVSDVDISKLIKFHKSHGKLATLTAVLPPGRFGALKIKNSKVSSFFEKPSGDGALINGGFFILNSRVMDYIDGDSSVWEQQPLRNLASDGELMAYNHKEFWQPMDTLKTKIFRRTLEF